MLRAVCKNIGLNPRRIPAVLRGYLRYRSQRKAFRALDGAGTLAWGRELPILTEWNESSGHLGGYFHQDLAVARWIHHAAPRRHIDIGSRIDGFVGNLAVFRPVEVIDIRPQPVEIEQVKFHQLDLMKPLPEAWIGCTDSLSCLHTIEHFGLGRYGDPLDPLGHIKGLEQLKRMIEPGGVLYLSTPIGIERVEFNAHRVFSPSTLLAWFGNGWRIERSAVVHDEAVQSSDDGSAVGKFTGDHGIGIVAARRCD